MTYQLRGHHLLCLLGFRGMGYSPAFTHNMTSVYEQLRLDPATTVRIVRGSDDLCVCFPADKPNHCETATVHDRDLAILRKLELAPGAELAWDELLQRVRRHMEPADIPRLCATCPWQPYGVCEAGLGRIVAGQGLAPLPSVSPDGASSSPDNPTI